MSPHGPTLAEWRRQRSNRVGLRISKTGVYLSVGAAAIELLCGAPEVVPATLLFTLGTLISIRLSRGNDEFVWAPGYIALWLQSLLVLAQLGGWKSPLLPLYVSLLISAGLVVQTRFPVVAVISFGVLNYVGWVLAGLFGLTAAVAAPVGVELTLTLAVAGGVLLCVVAETRAQEELFSEYVGKSGELLEARSGLAHVERLSQIGTLLAASAHEMSQPVQAISNAADLIERSLAEKGTGPDVVKRLNRHIREGSEALSRMVRQLRDFSRRDEFRPVTVDVREVLESVQSLARLAVKQKRAKLRFHYPEQPLRVVGDPIHLKQVLLNLVRNASDAVGAGIGSRIEVAARRVGCWVRLEVLDDGPGIPLELQGRVFNEYFTTKDRGKGTGLGLSICAKLLEQNRGRIFFSSTAGATRFVVDLKACEAEALAS